MINRSFHFPVSLAGGYRCSLTDEQRNQWSRYVRTKAEYENALVSTRQFELCPCAATVRASIAADGVLFDLGAKWYADILEQRELEELKRNERAELERKTKRGEESKDAG